MAKLPDPTMEPTIRVERAGKLLGISRATAYEAARTGQIPTLRIGNRLVVPTAALLRLLGLEGEPTTVRRESWARSGAPRSKNAP